MEINKTMVNHDEVNSKLAAELLPNTIVLVIYLLTGMFGNAFTLLVYFRRIRLTDERYFIPFLAFFDMIASIICSSLEIMEQTMVITFKNAIICKSFWSIGAFFTLASVSTLLLVAFQRYIKMCRSGGLQFTRFRMKVALLIFIVYCVMLSAPTAVLYGSTENLNLNGNFTEYRCGKLKNGNENVFMLYGISIVLTLLVSITLLVYIYIRISLKLLRHIRNIEKAVPKVQNTNVSEDGNTSNTILDESIDQTKDTLGDMKMNKIQDQNTLNDIKESENFETRIHHEELSKPTMKPVCTSVNTRQSEITENDILGSVPIEANENKTMKIKSTVNTKIQIKLTVMFLIITILFVICYVPKVILLMLEGVDDAFWENFTGGSKNGIIFISDLFIVNNIINPFVYAFMDTKFQNECKRMISCFS